MMDEPHHPRLRNVNEDDQLEPNEVMVAAAKTMLDELRRVSAAVRPLRTAG